MLQFKVFLLIFSLFAEAAWSVGIKDDAGNELTIDKPATRIVSLSPFTTELLFEIGAGELIIAVDNFSDYPQAATTLPTVGDYRKFDIEKILSLNPDLIIIWGSGSRNFPLNVFKNAGISVYISEPLSMTEISTTIRRFGQITDHNEQAKNVITDFETKLSEINARYTHSQPVSVFFQVWDSPLITIGGQHIVNDALQICQLQNIFRDTMLLSPSVNIEMVISRNPEIIISSISYIKDDSWKQMWLRWTNIEAVQNNQLYMIDSDSISRHTPRVLDGVRELCLIGDAARNEIKK